MSKHIDLSTEDLDEFELLTLRLENAFIAGSEDGVKHTHTMLTNFLAKKIKGDEVHINWTLLPEANTVHH